MARYGENIVGAVLLPFYPASQCAVSTGQKLFTVDGAVEDEAVVSQQILETVSGCVPADCPNWCQSGSPASNCKPTRRPFPSRPTASMWPTAPISWTAASRRKSYLCNNRLAVGYLRRRPQTGAVAAVPLRTAGAGGYSCLEYAGYCLIPPLGPRRCCSSSAGAARAKAGLAW